jgi:hypothetical protein
MISMTPFESYAMYMALKLHFTTDKYDYFKLKGAVRVNQEKFEKKNDKYFFKKLVKKYKDDEIPGYLVSNFVEGGDNWIGSIIGSEGDLTYTNWKKRTESLHYKFTEDMDFLLSEVSKFDDLFNVKNTHPPLLKYLLGKKINLETFVILNQILNFIPDFDKKIRETVIWKDVRRTVLKYSPFVNVDLVKYKNTLKKKVLG